MNYTVKYGELKEIFSSDINKISIPGSGICIHNVQFNSEEPSDCFLNINDSRFGENSVFSYPVFSPEDPKNRRIILLFHGLNERSWLKYLVWAYYLCELTGSYVVLFPIAFHINRSPEAWRDPRQMSLVMDERRSSFGNISGSSFANVALSERLNEDPLRFFFSGYRTLNDIMKLASTVRKGEHPVIPAGSRIDIFAYSIGAFLSQILLMSDPGDLFSESKLFIFCGGSVFSNMHGTSKLIMDEQAFERIYDYYLHDFEKTIVRKNPLSGFLNSTRTGLSFRSMIDTSRLRSFREKIFRSLGDRMHSVSLINDRVIPPAGILSTMKLTGSMQNVEIIEFPYQYSHENPFPLFTSEISMKVNSCFEMIFTQAAEFLI